MAQESGLPDLFMVAISWDFDWDPSELGFDGAILQRLAPRQNWYHLSHIKKIASRALARTLGWPSIYNYKEVAQHLLPQKLSDNNRFPCVIPNWDNTPRSGKRGLVLTHSSPENFRNHFHKAIEITRNVPSQQRLIFIKSWNEWAEGNHLEPDLKYGHGYLEVIKAELSKTSFLESACSQHKLGSESEQL